MPHTRGVRVGFLTFRSPAWARSVRVSETQVIPPLLPVAQRINPFTIHHYVALPCIRMILFISIPLQLPQSVLPFLMVLAKNLEAPYRTWPFRTSVLSVFSLHSVLRSFIKAQSRMNLHAQLCFPVSPLESALPRLAGSVHPKRLPERLSLLESALPKNGGALLDVQPSTCDFVPNVTNSEGGIPFLRRSRLGDGLSSDSFNISLLHCIHVSCPPVVVLSSPRCAPTENAFYLFSLHIVARRFPSQQGGYTPPSELSVSQAHSESRGWNITCC